VSKVHQLDEIFLGQFFEANQRTQHSANDGCVGVSVSPSRHNFFDIYLVGRFVQLGFAVHDSLDILEDLKPKRNCNFGPANVFLGAHIG
jgi:hypothetical protein